MLDINIQQSNRIISNSWLKLGLFAFQTFTQHSLNTQRLLVKHHPNCQSFFGNQTKPNQGSSVFSKWLRLRRSWAESFAMPTPTTNHTSMFIAKWNRYFNVSVSNGDFPVCRKSQVMTQARENGQDTSVARTWGTKLAVCKFIPRPQASDKQTLRQTTAIIQT